MIWIATIYLAGVVLGYLSYRYETRLDWAKRGFEYTTSDRAFGIVMSIIFSWVWVIANVIMIAPHFMEDSNKPAKW